MDEARIKNRLKYALERMKVELANCNMAHRDRDIVKLSQAMIKWGRAYQEYRNFLDCIIMTKDFGRLLEQLEEEDEKIKKFIKELSR